MARHFMAYWKPSQPIFDDPSALLNHAASNQFKRCRVGDVVWIVTLQNGQLHLVGQIPVANLVNRDQACRLLNQDDLWDADWHIISDPKGGSPVRRIPIHRIADKLRFVSKKGEEGRILMENSRISGTALQTMRQLSDDSIDLLDEQLRSANQQVTTLKGRGPKRGRQNQDRRESNIARAPQSRIPVKVLSVQQPYADLIIRGIKWCENRTWNTHHRGRLYIHASSATPDSDFTDDFIRKKCGVKSNKDFRRGCIIGHVELVDVRRIKKGDFDEAFDLAIEMRAKYSLSDGTGALMHVFGPCCFIFTNPVELDKPVCCKGDLKIWNGEM